jgi:hypothetical protein
LHILLKEILTSFFEPPMVIHVPRVIYFDDSEKMEYLRKLYHGMRDFLDEKIFQPKQRAVKY